MRHLSCLLLLAACASPSSKVGSDGSDASDGADGTDGGVGTDGTDTGDPGPRYPDLQQSGCGGPAYEWLPLDEMGAVVAYEKNAGFSLPAAAIQALLESQGFGDALVARYDVELYKIRYLTQDRGEAVEVTGYAAYPVLPAAAPVPTVLWLHPTMGFGDACAPTSGSLEGAAFPVLWATQGYAVAAPDYLGMNGWGAPSDRMHPWVVAEPTALASLDALRATARLQVELSLSAQPDLQQVLAFGASQGGHAALFADHYAQGYAPEMGFIGVIAAIPPTDLAALAVFGATTASEATLGLAGGMVTTWSWYGESADLSGVLQPEIADVLPPLLSEACDDFGSLIEGVDDVSEVYTPEFMAAAATGSLEGFSPWDCYMNESSLMRSTALDSWSMVPKLMVLGGADDLAWAPPARADAQALCDLGVPVEYVECEGLGHVDAAVQNIDRMVRWGQDRVSGLPVSGCVLHEPERCGG